LQNLRPDSVHVMVPSLGYGRGWAPHLILGWLAENLPTCQRVLTLHEYAMYSPLGRWRLQGALRAAHKVVCTNHRDRRVLRHRQALPGKVRVIPLGSVVAPTARSQRPDVFSGSSRRLVHFGTVMPNKGWETLLPAWQQLQQGGGAWQLEAVGALEPEQYAYHAAVAREIERRGLSAAVHFTGYLGHQQVRAAFKNSLGVAVLPFHGGAALNRSSLVTALCAGLAVVSTRPAQPLEGLRHGEHFWLVEPGDPRGLAAGIRRVAQDAQLRRHLQAGARRAAQRFAWPRIAAQTLGLVRGAS
jgi:glycosyltransferase involved in cell wall biosynthesis